jgi:hypothetical protein
MKFVIQNYHGLQLLKIIVRQKKCLNLHPAHNLLFIVLLLTLIVIAVRQFFFQEMDSVSASNPDLYFNRAMVRIFHLNKGCHQL